MKLNYKRTILVGFAFFLISAFWQAYDAIVPLILTNHFGLPQTASGVVMSVDNVLAVFMLPIFGALSDKVCTKFGKRTPFIVVGTVAAGTPILATQNIEKYLDLPLVSRSHREKDLFALTVKGESMIEAGILPGDTIIVHRDCQIRNGDIVVALIEDEATVKTFYQENGHFRLQPENSTMEPIIVKELSILGKVISVHRFYEGAV